MIVAGPGAAFTGEEDGDQRGDDAARARVAHRLGIPADWATVRQMHGDRVAMAGGPGDHGESDGLVTTKPALPLAVFTADCLGVVLSGAVAVGVAHAGWRGLAAGILERTAEAMDALGSPPRRAVAGPGIGPCCFEVGPEVRRLFPRHLARTGWGTPSVDLYAAAADRLGMPVDRVGECTRCGGGFSHRRDATPHRMAAIGWLAG